MDYAVLRTTVPKDLPAFSLEKNKIELGTKALAFGTTKDLDVEVVSNVVIQEADQSSFKHSETLPHGFSGGPILDAETGRVIAIAYGSWGWDRHWDPAAQMWMREVRVNMASKVDTLARSFPKEMRINSPARKCRITAGKIE